MILAAGAAPSLIRPMSKEETKGEPPADPKSKPDKLPEEIGGPPGPEPTRYGDWQYKGRVTDF
jgi:hypothetical protein